MKILCHPVIFLSSLGVSLTTPAIAETIYPEKNWVRSSPESVQIAPQKLKEWEKYNFDFAETNGRRTDALILIRHGKIVYEKYNYGYTRTTRHLSWSMAKSFNAALFGIAQSEKLISEKERMIDFFPSAPKSLMDPFKRENITLLNLLTMTSGLTWFEDDTGASLLKSDVVQMLYTDHHRNMAAYAASKPMSSSPGGEMNYSTGSTMIVMSALRSRMPKSEYDLYPWRKLFNPIGMKNVVWEQDNSGTFVAGSYLYATAEDFARFGYLLLNQGRWNDQQVVPQEWVKRMTESTSISGAYGIGVWLNHAPEGKPSSGRPLPNAPEDTFLEIGHVGQSITIIPSKDLIAVRLAHDVSDGAKFINWNTYLELLLRAVDSENESPVSLSPVSFSSINSSPILPSTDPKIMQLISSVRAKDYCSCRFVIGQTHEFCTNLVQYGFPDSAVSVDAKEKSVTYGVGTTSTKASMTSEKYGCSF